MLELEALKVDVFTDEPLAGNPAGLVLGADDLDEMQMQRIAVEMGLKSTAFVLRSRRADVRLRYFTPMSEEPICGHSTIGALWALAVQDAFGGSPGGRRRLETVLGILPFHVDPRPDGRTVIWMTQKRPLFAEVEDVAEVAAALGVGADKMFHEEFPLCRASTGVPCLLVPMRTLEGVERLDPKGAAIEELAREHEVNAVYVYTWNVVDKDSTLHARCFAVTPDFHEDPASALPAGALCAYLAHNDLVPRHRYEEMVIEQGTWVGRHSKLLARIEKRGSAIVKVEVGGSAAVSLSGRLYVG
ncbi:MAG: PhzF family phenazine biosynthesis protein [Methanobacteriota archaeon]|nr:MAG: PhzF family phenazine biosynthesis protein [Euryarchaeota archaeon]